jgi:hypothetical protein
MQQKSYAEFLRQFIGAKGNRDTFGDAVFGFIISENGRGEILEVGDDYVVFSDGERRRCCVPIAAFSVRYVV